MYGILCLGRFLTSFGRNCHCNGRRNFRHELKHYFTLSQKMVDVREPSEALDETKNQKNILKIRLRIPTNKADILDSPRHFSNAINQWPHNVNINQ